MVLFLAVQHERKPIVDRKEAHKSSTSENDQEMMSQSKSRLKKDSNNDTVNYLSLFQLNPLLMHAAAGVNSSQNFQTSPSKAADSAGIKIEEAFVDDMSDAKLSMNNESTELIESVLEQKHLNETLFDMIAMIESSLQGGFESYNNGNADDELTSTFLTNLMDENLTQFKIQLPNLLPKMHFVSEVGSRILFKSIDWLREIQVWQFFGAEAQSEMLKLNWSEMLVLGLAQTIATSSQPMQLKSMIISTLVNYVKSLIICNSDPNQNKLAGKGEAKPTSGQKLKKMLSAIMKINKFIDSAVQLELDGIEFAHLRILCLFNPNKFGYLPELRLKPHHQKVAANLQDYLRSRENSQTIAHERIVSIFQAISILPQLDGKIVEKLFFNILVDFIKIENVIPYIISLNSEPSERQEVKREKDIDVNDENNSHSMNSDDQRYYMNNYSGDEK